MIEDVLNVVVVKDCDDYVPNIIVSLIERRKVAEGQGIKASMIANYSRYAYCSVWV